MKKAWVSVGILSWHCVSEPATKLNSFVTVLALENFKAEYLVVFCALNSLLSLHLIGGLNVAGWLSSVHRVGGLLLLLVMFVLGEQDLHQTTVAYLFVDVAVCACEGFLRLVNIKVVYFLATQSNLLQELPGDFSALHECRLHIFLRVLALTGHEAGA